MASPYISSAATRHPRGVKIPAGVVTVLVLLALAAGAWFIWDQLFATHKVDVSQYESNDTPAAAARSRYFDQPTTNPTAGITHNADGTGEIQLVGAIARFTKNGSAIEVALYYPDLFRFVAAEDRQAHAARMMAMMNKNADSTADIVADQIARLRPLTPPNNIPVADTDRKQLLSEWAHYGAAAENDRPSIAASMDTDIRRLAAAGIDPATRAYADYARQIRAILSPDQIGKIRGLRRQRPQ